MSREVKREVSVMETPPWSTSPSRQKFFLASEDERQAARAECPEMVVRLATAEEIDRLHGDEDNGTLKDMRKINDAITKSEGAGAWQ